MFFDKRYMSIALDLAKKGIPFSTPNPSVGCVIVECDKFNKKDKIVGYGFTQKGGRPHAEAEAISKVSFKKNRKYICYSTLEPCCHIGRDESCATKILKTPISEVVFSLGDPDSRVRNNGLVAFEKKKIKVRQGILKREVIEIYKGYFLNRLKNRPFVTLKFASSMDGKIAYLANMKRWISNSLSRKIVHHLRSKNDAILVGSKTVKTDDPDLTCRLKGLEKSSPIRIIINRNFDLSDNSKIFSPSNVKTVIFSLENKKNIFFQPKGNNIEIIRLKSESFNLKYILKKISSIGVSNLIVEGGAITFGNFLQSKFVDKIMIFRSNFFIGDNGLSAVKFSNNYKKDDFKLRDIQRLKDNILEIYESKKSSDFFTKQMDKY